jgi:hypothetical protein
MRALMCGSQRITSMKYICRQHHSQGPPGRDLRPWATVELDDEPQQSKVQLHHQVPYIQPLWLFMFATRHLHACTSLRSQVCQQSQLSAVAWDDLYLHTMLCSAEQQRAAMPKSISEEDVFSAIGGLEISSKRDTDSNVAVLAACAPPQSAPTVHGAAQADAAAAAAAGSNAIPNSQSAGSLSGAGGNSIAASPRASGFTTGPSIGDLPQDEAPSRTLFVRILEPGIDAAELQRTFEVTAPEQLTFACVACIPCSS